MTVLLGNYCTIYGSISVCKLTSPGDWISEKNPNQMNNKKTHTKNATRSEEEKGIIPIWWCGKKGKLTNKLRKDNNLTPGLKKNKISELYQCHNFFNPQSLLGEVVNKYFYKRNKEKTLKIIPNFELRCNLVISVTAYYFTSTVFIRKENESPY